jgi:hypothetical protein
MVAKRGANEKEKEFLATTDTWFRPASLSSGPDGYLYVIDMYRQHIETPMSIPEDLQKDMDFDAGNKYGRIYRIVPKNAGPYKNVTHDLKNTSSIDLVPFLSNQNRFWRLQAQRLLLERQDKSVIPAVRALFTESGDARTRLHALYVLEALNALESGIVKVAMKDASPGVRENAAILSERFTDCLPQLLEMVNDSSNRVAFQATLSLGQFKNVSIVPVFVKVLEQRGESPWFRSAVLSAELGSGLELLKALDNKSFLKEDVSWKSSFIEDLTNVIGARNNKDEVKDLLNFLQKSANASLQKAGSKGLAKGLERREGTTAADKEKLKLIESESEKDAPKAIEEIKQLYININR